MLYLVALIVPPLALFLVGKPFQGIFNLILWLASIVFALTILGFTIGFVLWLIAALHAAFVVNGVKADKRNQALIDAIKGRDGQGG
ncbi:MAG: YqaE/Pmp3 family membrane protein [Tagaea sp. CACIAM 22H2]|nr:YqaE/Pmp3 family membrane protein [Tagaea sp. CACIAM 22H2]